MFILSLEAIKKIAYFSEVKIQARLIRSCRYLYKNLEIIDEPDNIIRKKRISELRKNNPLWQIIHRFPNKNYVWNEIVSNPNTLPDNLKEFNKSYPIDINWENVSNNPNLNAKFVLEYIGCVWDWSSVFNKSFVTAEFVKQVSEYITEENWACIYHHKNLSKEFVEQNINLYCFDYIYDWNYLDWNFVLNNYDFYDVDIIEIAMKINYIDDKIIEKLKLLTNRARIELYIPLFEKHPENFARFWPIYKVMLDNQTYLEDNSLWETCLENPFYFLSVLTEHDHDWNLQKMHKYEDITLAFIETLIFKKWNFEKLTKLSIMNIDFVLKYSDKNWDVKYICRYYKLNVNHIRNNKRLQIFMEELTANRSFAWETIMQNPDLNWHLPSFSANPNLTVDIIEKNQNLQWNFTLISMNKFMYSNIRLL